jgi:hypothetical protein
LNGYRVIPTERPTAHLHHPSQHALRHGISSNSGYPSRIPLAIQESRFLKLPANVAVKQTNREDFMARITVNQQPQELEGGPFSSLLDVLLSAQHQCWDAQRAIRSVTLDGFELKELNEENLAEIPWQEQDLAVELAPKRSCEEEPVILEKAMDYATHLQKGLLILADNLRLHPQSGHFMDLKDGLEGLSSLLELLGVLRNRETLSPASAMSCEKLTQALVGNLQEFSQAQKENDLILIADLLEYEFAPALQHIATLLGELNRSGSPQD